MEEIKCEIVRDMIPSYLDQVLTEESRVLLDKHMAQCARCRQSAKEEEERRREERLTEQKRGNDFSEKLLGRSKFVKGLFLGFLFPFALLAAVFIYGFIKNGLLYGFW